MIVTRAPVKWEGMYPDVAIKQGYNNIQNKFWIQVTDRRKGITIRTYMNEEQYQIFHNMGNFVFRQHGTAGSHMDPDTEFDVKIDEDYTNVHSYIDNEGKKHYDRPPIDPDTEMKEMTGNEGVRKTNEV